MSGKKKAIGNDLDARAQRLLNGPPKKAISHDFETRAGGFPGFDTLPRADRLPVLPPEPPPRFPTAAPDWNIRPARPPAVEHYGPASVGTYVCVLFVDLLLLSFFVYVLIYPHCEYPDNTLNTFRVLFCLGFIGFSLFGAVWSIRGLMGFDD